MTHEIKKIAKIIEELTIYFYSIGSDEFSSGINQNDEAYIITFSANFHPDYTKEAHELVEYLNVPKNDEIEDIYWELVGSGDPGEDNQLLLVGVMIDEVKIEFRNNHVSIEMHRIKN